MDGFIENVRVGKGLVSQMMGLEVAPDNLDVIELRGIFRQPLEGEPVGTFGKRRQCGLADVDRAVVEHKNDGLDRCPGLRAVEAIENLQMSNEVGAALGAGGGHNELALCPIERAHHGDFLRLPGRRHAQVGAAFGPGTGQIRMRQGLALIAEQQHDVAREGLRLAQLEPQTAPIDGVGILTALQRVPRSAKAKPPFFRSTLESCEREMVTPSRFAISSARRASVQLRRSATGAERSGSATRSAACAFNGSGPGAMRVLSASTPPFRNSLRHSRTVSSRTPNASAIRPLVQPPSVSRTARARSASARSALAATSLSAAL